MLLTVIGIGYYSIVQFDKIGSIQTQFLTQSGSNGQSNTSAFETSISNILGQSKTFITILIPTFVGMTIS